MTWKFGFTNKKDTTIINDNSGNSNNDIFKILFEIQKGIGDIKLELGELKSDMRHIRNDVDRIREQIRNHNERLTKLEKDLEKNNVITKALDNYIKDETIKKRGATKYD